MATQTTFPGADWNCAAPGDMGFDEDRLSAVGTWQAEHAGGAPYRLLVARHGLIVGEWHGGGMGPHDRQSQASASKSTYSTVLGIAVEEGVIGSVDDRVVEYYPEMMAVPAGQGPKENRHAFPENEDITFRQLIGNTSGYTKPGELPGRQFNYQTFGMNILTHAIATQYSLYKTADPERGAGFGKLTEWKVRDPIGGTWSWEYSNFDLHKDAKLGVFGYFTNYQMTARDMARLGVLWLQDGQWEGRQVAPAWWLREATKVSREILENEPEENWQYGYGFWCNDQGKLWHGLPRDSFAAVGAGRQFIWCDREHDVVVVQSPGTFETRFGPVEGAEPMERVMASLR